MTITNELGLNPSETPLVSVVMAVYNAAGRLHETLQSVLQQEGCAFEVIVIDDGSTDETPALLKRCAATDPRLRIFRQENAGLTAALVFGCAKARGRFIARQDADDLSIQGRLQMQSEYLLQHDEAVLVVGGVRFVAPNGEWVSELLPPQHIALSLSVDNFRAPPLVAGMFRSEAYHACGGFQREFVVAQDIDLWLRLQEQGTCVGLPALHYQARMTMGGISSRRREAQLAYAALAIECAKHRRAGQSDRDQIDAFSMPKRDRKPMTARERARFLYFIGACLHKTNAHAARSYYRQALQEYPLHLKALVRWLAAWL